jgi:Homeodomain-like domain-containing protein
MGSKIDTQSDEAEKAVHDIEQTTRRDFSAADRVRHISSSNYGRADPENRLLKKACWRMGSPIPEARLSDKLEILRLVEQSSLPARRTPEQLGIPHSTFYGWYDRYRTSDADSLADRRRGAGVEEAPGCRHPSARARAQGAAAVAA